VRVLTYNIWDGGDGRLDDLARVVEGLAPDAVALVEATSRPNAGSLARTLRMELVFGEANLGFHVAWLSQLPVRAARNHRPALQANTLV
jgi:exodeoxyribonuclease III